MEENTVNICLHVLKATRNKNSHDSYCVRNVPLFDSVTGLKAYFLDAQRNSGQQQIVTLLLVTSVKEIKSFPLLRKFNLPRRCP